MTAEACLPQLHSRRVFVESAEQAKARARMAGPIGTSVLTGPRGVGKTQLAVEWIKMRIGVGVPSFYVKARDLIDASYGRITVASQHAYKAHHYPVLVVDAIRPPQGDPDDTPLAGLVDDRYCLGLETLLICNTDPSALPQMLGDDVMDRVAETGVVISANWKSWRG